MTSPWDRDHRRRLEATLGVLAEVASTPAREDEPVIATGPRVGLDEVSLTEAFTIYDAVRRPAPG